MLGLYGGADQGIPVTTVDEMKTRLAAGPAPAKARIRRLPGRAARVPRRLRPTYRKDAAEDGWKRATAWFRKHGPA